MSFVDDMKRLKEQADVAGRPAPPPQDEIDEDAEVVAVFLKRGEAEAEKGGPGSGHFKHPGRPGKVGGSKPTGRAKPEPKPQRKPIEAQEEPKQTQARPEGPPSYFAPGAERDARRADGIYDVISETTLDSADIFLTQGIEPSFRPWRPALTTQYGPGKGLEKEGLYLANSDAFSRGTFGKVRLYLTIPKQGLRVGIESQSLGITEVAGALSGVDGAVTQGAFPASTFVGIEVLQPDNRTWRYMPIADYLSMRNLKDTPKLPTVGRYRQWVEQNAKSLFLSDDDVYDLAFDYNRAQLADKIWFAEEAGLI